MPTSFFDFHCHPGLKPLFADENSRPTPWDKLRISIKIHGWTIGINKLFNEVFNSQLAVMAANIPINIKHAIVIPNPSIT